MEKLIKKINDIFEVQGDRVYIKGKFLFDMWQTYGLPPEEVKRIVDENFTDKSKPTE